MSIDLTRPQVRMLEDARELQGRRCVGREKRAAEELEALGLLKPLAVDATRWRITTAGVEALEAGRPKK